MFLWNYEHFTRIVQEVQESWEIPVVSEYREILHQVCSARSGRLWASEQSAQSEESTLLRFAQIVCVHTRMCVGQRDDNK